MPNFFAKLTRFFLKTAAFFGVLFFLFYLSLSTQTGFNLTWAKLIRLIPGKLEYENLQIDFWKQHLAVRNIRYFHTNGSKIVDIQSADARLNWTSVFRLRAIFRSVDAKNFTLDLSNLPPRKQERNISLIFRTLTQRLRVEDCNVHNIHVLLKNGFLDFPAVKLSYQSNLVGKDELSFETHDITGTIIQKNLKIDQIRYEGHFALPDVVKEVFLFRDAKGKFTLKGAQVGEMKWGDLVTEATFDGEHLILPAVEFNFGKSAWKLFLKFAPFAQKTSGKLSSQGFIRAADIPGLKPRMLKAFQEYQLSLDFNLLGFTRKELDGEVSVQAQGRGNVINPENQASSVQLTAAGKEGVFHLKHFLVKTTQGETTATGSIDLNTLELDTNITARSLDFKTLITYLSDLELQGYINASGSIRGPVKSPDFAFKGVGEQTGYKILRFGAVDSDFKIKNGRMEYNGKASQNGSAQINVVSTAFFDKDRRTTQMNIQFANVEGGFLMANPFIKGHVSGSFQMEDPAGESTPPKGKLVASAQDVKMYSFNFGEVQAEGILSNRQFVFANATFHPPKLEKMQFPKPAVFQFTDDGFTLKGSPLAGMDFEGFMKYEQKDFFNAKVSCSHCATKPLLAVAEYPLWEGEFDGKASGQIVISRFANSKLQSSITPLRLQIGDTSLSNIAPILISFSQGHFNFDQVRLVMAGNAFKVGGYYSIEGVSQILVSGNVDLSLLETYPEYFKDAVGFADVNLAIKGNLKTPDYAGTIDFKGGSVAIRALGNTVEDLKGRMVLEGQKIRVENLEGTIDEGSLKLNGSFFYNGVQISNADLKAEAREMAYVDPGVLRLFLSGNLRLTGSEPSLLLSGILDITEGKYIKNFDVREFIAKPSLASLVKRDPIGFDTLRLDLKIKSSGELMVKNNAAEIYLKSDLVVTGTKASPKFQGALSVLDGTLNYFKINFDQTRGLIDFRDGRANAYVDLTAQRLFERSFEDIRVIAHIEGFTDNLQLSFTSEPPFEKREILALIFTGALPEDGQTLSGTSIASSILASQITNVISAPVTGFTHLDVFRLEASEPDSKSLTSLVVGKKITDRFTLEFKTDLSIEEPLTSVQASYLLFDNLVLKGSRSSQGRYRFDLSYQFRGF